MSPSPILLSTLAAAWPPEKWRDVTVLVAVSGGADSVALARGLMEVCGAGGSGRLVLAHFNHGLRGTESDADQALVEELARELGMEVLLGAGERERERGRGGEGEAGKSEESLRDLRYSYFKAAAGKCGARYVATAHTADDQVETVLHNVIRGTGLAGLAGIPRVRQLSEAATLVRPLLGVTRAEVLEYLKAIGQRWREDASNQSPDYTRNRLRHELLPLLERDYNPHVRSAIAKLSQIAGALDSLLEKQATAFLQFAARPAEGGVEIELSEIEGAHPALVQQALLTLWRWQDWPLQDMSFEKWEQLLALVTAPGGKRIHPPPQMFPGGVRAERRQGVLLLTRP